MIVNYILALNKDFGLRYAQKFKLTALSTEFKGVFETEAVLGNWPCAKLI